MATVKRASARACSLLISSYRLYNQCTHGPPFQLVEILLKFQYGNEECGVLTPDCDE